MPTPCSANPLEFEGGTRSQPEQDGSTISVFGGHTDSVVEVDHYSDIHNASLSEGGAPLRCGLGLSGNTASDASHRFLKQPLFNRREVNAS